MSGSLLVSTECPACGGPLDFLEGANAVQCDHCKSNLLVTGRKQILSYFVRPKLDVHRGVAKAMVAHKESGTPCRMISPQLYFIPYYRLTGHDFRWEAMPKEEKVPEAPSTLFSDPAQMPEPSIFEAVSQWISLIFGQKPLSSFQRDNTPELKSPPAKIPLLRKESKVFFQDQYIEKNFIGTECKEFGIYSLGIRPAVLKLELFGKSSLESLGKVVSPDLSPEAAFERGMKTAGGENLLFRQVLSRMLSLIYFPFWVMEVDIEGKHHLTVIDAVSETIIQLKIPLSFIDILSRTLTQDPRVIQFRSLVCPNCGWDFAVRKDNVIFFCDSCKKTWQMTGDHLSEVACQVIHPPDMPGDGTMKYLPFWVIDANSGQAGNGRYFLPGFRYRRLKTLADLAEALTRKSPSYIPTDHLGFDAYGCYYDQEDAVNFAKLILAGTILNSHEGKLLEQPLRIDSNKIILSWIPFRAIGDSLIEPFTGLSISNALLG